MRRTMIACVVGTLLLSCSPALAQAGKGGSKTPPPPPGKGSARAPEPAKASPPAAPIVAEVSDKVARIPSIGLTVPVPAGCEAITESVGGAAALNILPEDQTWRITIRSATVEDEKMTVTQFADRALKLLSEQLGYAAGTPDPNAAARRVWTEKVAKGQIVLVERLPNARDPRPRFIGAGAEARACEQWYALYPQSKGEDVLRGFAVVAVKPGQFAVYELVGLRAEYEKLRPIYEIVLNGSKFAAPGEAELARNTAVETGKHVLAAMTEADYRQLLASRGERWFRLYRPGKTGKPADDAEIGYMRFVAKVGQRGDVDPERSKANWGVADRQEGYILNIDMRLIQDGKIIDSRAGYFMSPDKKREFWTIKSGVKNPGDARSAISTEVGARDDLSMSVAVTVTGGEDKTIKPIIQSDAYVSRVDAFLLPQILVKSKVASEFGFYAWQSQHQRIRYRADVLEPNPATPGTWKLTTRFGDDSAAQVAIYTESGDLVRTTTPEGTIWEPIGFDALYQLWSAKKLPLD